LNSEEKVIVRVVGRVIGKKLGECEKEQQQCKRLKENKKVIGEMIINCI